MSEFRTAFRGYFSGILEWQDLDRLWQRLRQSDARWYIYAVGEPVPENSVSKPELERFIDELDRLLHKEHREDYCGIVYVDDRDEPGLIKVFDPNNLGVVCGFSDNPPLPGWILSTMQPEPIEDLRPTPGNRRRWWQKIWNRES